MLGAAFWTEINSFVELDFSLIFTDAFFFFFNVFIYNRGYLFDFFLGEGQRKGVARLLQRSFFCSVSCGSEAAVSQHPPPSATAELLLGLLPQVTARIGLPGVPSLS